MTDMQAQLQAAARLAVVETIYFQQQGAQPTSIETKFASILKSDEQPYTRKLKIGEEWKALDCGWLEQVSMLILANDEGRFLQVIPTEEEKKAMAAKVIEVITHTGGSGKWLIPPGESFRGRPSDIKKVQVRCQSGIAQCTLTIFPF